MVNKWSFYWANLNPVSGSEQSGSRPVLVISNDMVNELLPVVTVIPVSSLKLNTRVYATEVFLSKDATSLAKDSVAMIHQIRTIAKERLGNRCGMLQDEEIKEDIHAVMRSFFEL